jgi:nitrogen-specific signal transduction histidine kinase
MSIGLAETLLAANTDVRRMHRRVVQVGAAASWTAAAVFLVAGFLGGNDGMFVEAVGPIIVAGFMTVLIALRRENGGMALFAAAIVTMVMYTVVGSEDTLLPASLALVVICAIGMLLIERYRIVTVTGVALFLAVAPLFWSLPLTASLQLGVVMALAFVMTSAIFFTIRNAATALNVRFQTLFENSPTAVMEEDWTKALAYVRSEYTGRPDRIRAFLMAYPVVVQRAVSEAKIVRVNQAAIELLEADGPEDLLGYRDGNKVTDETLQGFVNALVALYEGRSSFEEDIPALTMKGRSIWLQTRCVNTSPGSTAASILIGLADITHIKARQEAMADLVKAKDEFIAGVSHELRTPLTAVIGLTSEMSSTNSLSDEERSELMGLVADQAVEMSNIVDDLLVAARAEMGTVAVEATVVDLQSELEAAIEGLGIEIRELPVSTPSVIADPSRVRQVLRNLLTNAERYGGPNRRIVSGAFFDNVWLEVRDDGPGVTSDESVHIFEPYGTAHSGVRGSVGLGLSVARQLTELMGGSLTYRRDLDETVFRLELPVSRERDQVLASNNAGD